MDLYLSKLIPLFIYPLGFALMVKNVAIARYARYLIGRISVWVGAVDNSADVSLVKSV